MKRRGRRTPKQRQWDTIHQGESPERLAAWDALTPRQKQAHSIRVYLEHVRRRFVGYGRENYETLTGGMEFSVITGNLDVAIRKLKKIEEEA